MWGGEGPLGRLLGQGGAESTLRPRVTMGLTDHHLSYSLCGPDCFGRFWKGGACGGVGGPGFKYPSNQVMKAGKSVLLPEPLFPHQQNWGDDDDEVDEVLDCCER